ncbi:glycosyltransferase family 4 protein [Tessaracoccus caeni]|uniref:glycosyltransferase family 4 protein n=1 Tax=Tessaracoccus caeni TaxID=3031239 RepID=UPI0023DBF63D|nr:glycosyltransferase family 4 protein [Tessaracoccus caeni]MDF1488479.1 glycosyltransferase family 4 protein [Tessaracoccus caeni]
MRIALVCPYNLDTPGGVATHVLGLARWLDGQGHRATVIAPGTSAPSDIDVHLLGPTVDFRFNGSTAQLAISHRQRRAAADAVRDADVVHVHEPLTPGAAYAAARAARRLVVTHHASFPVPGLVRPLLRRRARVLGPRHSLAVSAAAARTAREATGLEPAVLPNAVWLPAAAEKPRAGRPRVVFVGRRDDARKGYATFSALARSGIDAEFIAIGPGGDPGPGVRTLGVIDDDHLAEELGAAQVVVAPNLGGESFGMVLVEALAAGCALVASDLEAFRQVVGDEPVAHWFPPGDPGAAVSALRRALEQPIDPQRARAVAERFSWDVVGPRVLDAYLAARRGADGIGSKA